MVVSELNYMVFLSFKPFLPYLMGSILRPSLSFPMLFHKICTTKHQYTVFEKHYFKFYNNCNCELSSILLFDTGTLSSMWPVPSIRNASFPTDHLLPFVFLNLGFRWYFPIILCEQPPWALVLCGPVLKSPITLLTFCFRYIFRRPKTA